MKRPAALYALLFVAPALGAELVVPVAPVQLSFSFAVAAPVTIAPLAAALPVAAPVAVLPPVLAQAALPALAPAAAPANAAAAEPAAVAAPETALAQVKNLAARSTKMDYVEFGQQLARRPALDLSPFNQADAKRRILAASGYTHLYGAGGVRVPLSAASDVRVGKAFLSVKRAFDRRATQK